MVPHEPRELDAWWWWCMRGSAAQPYDCGCCLVRLFVLGAEIPMATKKALLIGINYVGTRAALRGCHNDVGAWLTPEA